MIKPEFEFVEVVPHLSEYDKAPVNDVIPTKSSSVYQFAYQRFIKWCEDKNLNDYSQSTLLEYFFELRNKMKMKGSTMWSQYSMIKSLLISKHGIDISRYLKLREYLKKENEGYTRKNSSVFTKEQFEKFLLEAPDETYLGMKIVLLFGVSGACRCEELVKMKIDDIQDLGTLLYIKIPGSKGNKPRSFTIVQENCLTIYRKYVSLRPDGMKDRRFFLKYSDGKCYRLVMGIHKLSSVPRVVASYLKLPNWKEYTGHCLRRTSATVRMDE